MLPSIVFRLSPWVYVYGKQKRKGYEGIRPCVVCEQRGRAQGRRLDMCTHMCGCVEVREGMRKRNGACACVFACVRVYHDEAVQVAKNPVDLRHVLLQPLHALLPMRDVHLSAAHV